MIGKINALNKKNAINEIAAECVVAFQIKYLYKEMYYKSLSYMQPNEAKNIYNILVVGFSKYLTSICNKYEERFPDPQSVILSCSLNLIDAGKTLPVLKKLNDANCTTRLVHISSNLMRHVQSCENPTEREALKTFIELLDPVGCLFKNFLFSNCV